MNTTISNNIFNIIERNIHRMSFEQKETIRNKINDDILKSIERGSWMFGPTDYTKRQFGIK